MRKPSKSKTPLNGPRRLWPLMAAAGKAGFTVPELVKQTSAMEPSAVKSYVLTLIARGYVERIGAMPAAAPHHPARRRYRVVRKSATAPGLGAAPGSAGQGRARAQMWNAMRVLQRFRLSELAVAASTDDVAVTIFNAQKYVFALCRAGLAMAYEAHRQSGNGRGKGARAGQYGLKPASRTGPLAPKVMAKGVFDPNTETLHAFKPASSSAAGKACEVRDAGSLVRRKAA